MSKTKFPLSPVHKQSKPYTIVITELVESHKSSCPLCSHSFSEPTFGHYNKDDILDVVLEEDIGNHTKRVSRVLPFLHFIFLASLISVWIIHLLHHCLNIGYNSWWEVWWCPVGSQPFGHSELAQTCFNPHHQPLLDLCVLGHVSFRFQHVCEYTTFVKSCTLADFS